MRKPILLGHLDKLPLNRWMTVREMVNYGKKIGIKNQKDEYFSDGSYRNACGDSVKRKDGLFECDFDERGRIKFKRLRDGCLEVARQLMEMDECERQAKHGRKKQYVIRIPKSKMSIFPKPGKLSEQVYMSSKVYV